jgi:hypothetical protein
MIHGQLRPLFCERSKPFSDITIALVECAVGRSRLLQTVRKLQWLMHNASPLARSSPAYLEMYPFSRRLLLTPLKLPASRNNGGATGMT